MEAGYGVDTAFAPQPTYADRIERDAAVIAAADRLADAAAFFRKHSEGLIGLLADVELREAIKAYNAAKEAKK